MTSRHLFKEYTCREDTHEEREKTKSRVAHISLATSYPARIIFLTFRSEVSRFARRVFAVVETRLSRDESRAEISHRDFLVNKRALRNYYHTTAYARAITSDKRRQTRGCLDHEGKTRERERETH